MDVVELFDQVLVLLEDLADALILAVGVVGVLELLELVDLVLALQVLLLARVLQPLDLLLDQLQLLLVHLVLATTRISNEKVSVDDVVDDEFE